MFLEKSENASSAGPGNCIAEIEEGMFFGEMEYMLDRGRSATVRANMDMAVLMLSSEFFEAVLKIDAAADRQVIESLSQRLKYTNEKFIAASQEMPELP
ncbi:hypothetical protein AGMMS49991_04280 [Spirochaetia bacterium]|nr:hypothetical protein AGMMS49991_04280 [Spirochaetia bacterium]